MKTISKLTEELDIIFSKYIRKSRADQYGMVTCDCGCGKRIHWKQAQLSHYRVRGNMLTRWDERNVFVAYAECNLSDQKHDKKISRFMDDELREELIRLSNIKMKFMPYELEEMIKEYKQKFKAL